jgi:hypothetical protein
MVVPGCGPWVTQGSLPLPIVAMVSLMTAVIGNGDAGGSGDGRQTKQLLCQGLARENILAVGTSHLSHI